MSSLSKVAAVEQYRFFIFDPGSDPTQDGPLDAEVVGSRALAEVFEKIEAEGGTRDLRMPEICAGDHVGFDLLINVAGGFITSFGIWVGSRLYTYFKNRKRGASGDVNALMFVALYYLSLRYPDVIVDRKSCESLGQVISEEDAARAIKAIYLYRIRVFNSDRVFVVEVTSDGDLVTLVERGQVP